jgi:hypothetical protein|tara:strand:+ start:219 stop:509 length:291 start_codon:yes stop_codon:yes gene_type:complete
VQKKEEKRKKNVKVSILGTEYFLHKIIWEDIVGDSTIGSYEEFNKMQTATITTFAFIFKKDTEHLYTFASHSADGFFGDRNIIPNGVVKSVQKMSF